MNNQFLYYAREGLADLKESLALRHIWWNLAVFEIRARYKRTKLGPFWITLSTLVLLVAMGPLYAHLFGKDVGEYYLYIACGFIFWNYLTSNILETARVFPESHHVILSYGFPVSLYLFKTVFRNIIVMLHNVVIVILALLVFSTHWGVHMVGFFPAYILVVLNLFFIGIIIALVNTRFRDIEQIINSILTVMFFLTPVLWDANMLGEHHYMLYFNPFFSFIDSLRAPLISSQMPWDSLFFLTFILLLVAPLSTYMLGRYKHRVALWV